ncbi:hypothetical protein DFJ73DRAFT_811579 [Zopfochytrium polystomum]|nr:hypothetical protein DFJ73DRAFT_811579 [Zopfochytrium polystomum]
MAASSFSARSSNLRTRRTSGAVAQDHASVSILHVNHPASAAPTAAGGVPASQYGVEKAGATQRNAKKSQDLFTSFSAWAEQFERWQTKPLMRRVMYAVQLGTAFICIFIMLFLRQLPYLALFLGQFVVTGAILLYHTLEAFNAVRKCPLVLAKATIAVCH